MVKKKEKESSNLENFYFEDEPLVFFSTGSTVLDCSIGGGLPLKRISNFVGDKSSNKTGIAIEAMANFRKTFPNGKIYYIECESAFDISYARRLGLPNDDNTFVIENKEIVSEVNDVITDALKSITEENVEGLIIIDSLDSVKVSYDPAIDAGYSGAKRAGLIGNMIINQVGPLKRCNAHLMIISQVRYNIGVSFGEKFIRSGGKALDFHSSQVVWLAMTEKIKKTIKGIERPIGIWIKSNCKKNKISMPYRTSEFPVIFGFGIDDVTSCLYFLKDVKGALEELGIEKKDIETMSREVYEKRDSALIKKIQDYTIKTWDETEKGFQLQASKYE